MTLTAITMDAEEQVDDADCNNDGWPMHAMSRVGCKLMHLLHQAHELGLQRLERV